MLRVMLIRSAWIAAGALAALLVLQIIGACRLPALEPWHTVRLEEELDAADIADGIDLARYLQQEDRLFAELAEHVEQWAATGADQGWSRYAVNGPNNPLGFEPNWNRTFVLDPDGEPQGGALLLHGLTDSPYSLRSVGEVLRQSGYRVVGLRLPGHGTTPSALLTVGRRDWRAAAKMALTSLRQALPSGLPIMVVGYSNGGLVALDIALDGVAEKGPVVQNLILIVPSLGVSRLAAVAGTHRFLSWIPGMRRIAWKDVMPEFDPYKYNSFNKNAGWESYSLGREVSRRLDRLAGSGAAGRLPRMVVFASLADATVEVEAIVSRLLGPLGRSGDELVLFDVNRRAEIEPFFRYDPADRVRSLSERSPAPWTLTLITNRDVDSQSVEARRWSGDGAAPEVEDLGLTWPPGVYSLSHLAVAFPPDDPVYGWESPDGGEVLRLGTLAPRGEKGLLTIPPGWFSRLRANPFWDYVERRVRETAESEESAWLD